MGRGGKWVVSWGGKSPDPIDKKKIKRVWGVNEGGKYHEHTRVWCVG